MIRRPGNCAPLAPRRYAPGGDSRSRTRSTSRSKAISGNFSGSTPRRDQARSETQSRHLVLGQPLGRFPVGIVTSSCLAKRSWYILFTRPNFSSWDFSIRRSGSTFQALLISQLRTLSQSITPLRINPTFAACTWDQRSILGVANVAFTSGRSLRVSHFVFALLC